MARALLTSARDFRHGLEKKSLIQRSQQARLYFDKAHETLETVNQVTLEGAIKIQVADASTVPEHGHEHGVTTMGTTRNTDSDATSVPLSIPASLVSSAPFRGPALQVVLDPIRPPQSFSLPTPPDDHSPQEPAAPYDGIKGTRPSINPAIVVSPLPTPPLTPEIPEKPSPASPPHLASPADA